MDERVENRYPYFIGIRSLNFFVLACEMSFDHMRLQAVICFGLEMVG